MLKSIVIAAAIALTGGGVAIAQMERDVVEGLSVISYSRGVLPNDTGAEHIFNAVSGHTYVVIGACDEGCSNLDLGVWAGGNTDMGVDLEADDNPVVVFQATETGVHKVYDEGPQPQARDGFDANTCISFREGDSPHSYSIGVTYTNSCNQPLTLKVCAKTFVDCTAESHWYTTPIAANGSVNLSVDDNAVDIRHKACTASQEHVWFEADPYFDLPARYICSPR